GAFNDLACLPGYLAPPGGVASIPSSDAPGSQPRADAQPLLIGAVLVVASNGAADPPGAGRRGARIAEHSHRRPIVGGNEPSVITGFHGVADQSPVVRPQRLAEELPEGWRSLRIFGTGRAGQ